MGRKTPIWLSAIVFAAIPSPALACIGPPPAIQLPDEPDEAYKIRSEALVEAELDENRRRSQVNRFDHADRVELAIVRQSTPIPVAYAGGALGAKIEAEPVAPLKGSGPVHTVTLADWHVDTCGIGGSGSATSARLGDYVILFYNISGREVPWYFGIKIAEAREPRLVAAVRDAAKRLRDGARQAKPPQ